MPAAQDTPTLVCSSCGAETRVTASFCPNCGRDLRQSIPPAPIAGVPAQTQSVRWFAPGVLDRIPDNIAGMLAYLLLPAIVFLLLPRYRQNRFVRFHSFQCLFTAGVLFLVHVFLGVLLKFLPLVVLPIYGLLILADVTLPLLLLVKAYQHEFFKLPVVGELAEQRTGECLPGRRSKRSM